MNFQCFSNFSNKIIKICLIVFNFSKIISFKYCRIKFYFYLIQFLKYFFIYTIYIEIFLQFAWPPLASAWPPLNISSGYGPGSYHLSRFKSNVILASCRSYGVLGDGRYQGTRYYKSII